MFGISRMPLRVVIVSISLARAMKRQRRDVTLRYARYARARYAISSALSRDTLVGAMMAEDKEPAPPQRYAARYALLCYAATR